MDKKYLWFPTKSSNFAPDKENDNYYVLNTTQTHIINKRKGIKYEKD